MSVGENIKKYRSDKTMTQLELAEVVGVGQSMIAQLERGTRTLTVPLGKQIAEALNVKFEELIA